MRAFSGPMVGQPNAVPTAILPTSAMGPPLQQPVQGFKQINLPVESNEIISRQKLQELLSQISPNMKLDPEVEDYLMDVADDFIESVVTFSCDLAKHRKASTLEVKDVQLHLEKNCGIRIPGLPIIEPKNIVKNETVNKQRLELVKQAQENQGQALKRVKLEDPQKE